MVFGADYIKVFWLIIWRFVYNVFIP
jgi:hypothetical protein